MSLNWDVSKVKNNEEICFVKKEDGQYLSPVTESLVWLTLGTGIGSITEANAHEFYVRMKMYWGINDYSAKEKKVKWEDIVAHIGLSTNVFPKVSNAKFMSKEVKYAKRSNPLKETE